jgi:hypothetical protein
MFSLLCPRDVFGGPLTYIVQGQHTTHVRTGYIQTAIVNCWCCKCCLVHRHTHTHAPTHALTCAHDCWYGWSVLALPVWGGALARLWHGFCYDPSHNSYERREKHSSEYIISSTRGHCCIVCCCIQVNWRQCGTHKRFIHLCECEWSTRSTTH